jgi:hypothetical protein
MNLVWFLWKNCFVFVELFKIWILSFVPLSFLFSKSRVLVAGLLLSPDLYLTARDFSQRRCPDLLLKLFYRESWICCPVSVLLGLHVWIFGRRSGISRSARLCSFLPIWYFRAPFFVHLLGVFLSEQVGRAGIALPGCIWSFTPVPCVRESERRSALSRSWDFPQRQQFSCSLIRAIVSVLSLSIFVRLDSRAVPRSCFPLKRRHNSFRSPACGFDYQVSVSVFLFPYSWSGSCLPLDSLPSCYSWLD